MWSNRFRNAALINALISALWTLIILLPISPFPILQRIIVGGGPGIWFTIGYLLFLTLGFCGFVGFSFLYYVAESVQNRKINNGLAWLHLIATYVGIVGSTMALAVAGVLGGYASIIMHAPTEEIRLILEPFLNPIRILSLFAFIGIVSGLLSLTYSKSEYQ
jgi:hypothetical protein